MSYKSKAVVMGVHQQAEERGRAARTRRVPVDSSVHYIIPERYCSTNGGWFRNSH